jgi:hypothetical protein
MMACLTRFNGIPDLNLMTHHTFHCQIVRIAAASSLAVAMFASLAGCGGQTTTQTSVRSAPTFGSPADRADRARQQHGGTVQFGDGVMSETVPRRVTNTVIRAEIQLQGNVPYDNMSVPLVSPDGRYIATQTNISPTWPTLLAEWEADVPVATRIEIYRRPLDGNAVGHHMTLHEPLILGRSYDNGGFLVEAPQDDGSRWIGYIEWESGELHWLVADEFVNAFASLGPGGRLAWSRRDVNDIDDHFELVVRGPDQNVLQAASHAANEWSYSRDRESWLMPTWSGNGNGLFAFVLTGDYLEAVYAVGSDPSAFIRIPVAFRAFDRRNAKPDTAAARGASATPMACALAHGMRGRRQ